MITDEQIRVLLVFSLTGKQTSRKIALHDACVDALNGSTASREHCTREHLRLERIRNVIRDFFRDKPPGTTIKDSDLDAYRQRLREASQEDEGVA